jgi:hypothetical protein
MKSIRPTFEDVAGLVAVATGPLAITATPAALDRLLARLYAHRLFTVLRLVRAEKASERLYSSNVAAYPLLGRKATPDTVWGRIVLDGGQVLVSRNRDDIRTNFSDHETIFSLGIDSMINVPLLWNGAAIGSANVSFAGAGFESASPADLQTLVGILAPVVAATFTIAGDLG